MLLASLFFDISLQGITTIPSAKALLDTVLSETQRRTPTEVHKQFKISRIRKFYMRKVKYVQQAFRDRLQRILTQLPHLDVSFLSLLP